MERGVELSRLPRWKGVLASAVFLLVVGGAAWWFVASVSELHAALTALPPTIVFSNGFGYTAGAVVAFAPLLLSSLYTAATTKIVPVRYQKRGFASFAAGLVIMVVATPLSSLWIDDRLEGAGYELCAPASSRWLNYRQAVYVKRNADECQRVTQEGRARR